MKKFITLIIISCLLLPANAQGLVKVAAQVGKALTTKKVLPAVVVKTGQAIQQSSQVSSRVPTRNLQISNLQNQQQSSVPFVTMDSILCKSIETNRRLALFMFSSPDLYSIMAEQYPDSLVYLSSRLKLSSHVEPQYVDLGLPSGTLWKDCDEPGMYTQTEKDSLFEGSLPTLELFQELHSQCTWEWEGRRYKVTGPNGNSITLNADGYCSSLKRYYFVGVYGSYWVAPYTVGADVYTNLFFCFTEKGINGSTNEYAGARNVRLVKLAANQ